MRRYLFLILLLTITVACGSLPTPEPSPTSTALPIPTDTPPSRAYWFDTPRMPPIPLTPAIATPAPAPTQAYVCGEGYPLTVIEGDTLQNISEVWGTPVEDIIRVNNLDPNVPLYVGQFLLVPMPWSGLNGCWASDGTRIEPPPTPEAPSTAVPELYCDEYNTISSWDNPKVQGVSGIAFPNNAVTEYCVAVMGGWDWYWVGNTWWNYLGDPIPVEEYDVDIDWMQMDCPGYEPMRFVTWADFYGGYEHREVTEADYLEIVMAAGYMPPLMIPAFTYDGPDMFCKLTVSTGSGRTYLQVDTVSH